MTGALQTMGAWTITLMVLVAGCAGSGEAVRPPATLGEVERDRVIEAAERAMGAPPVTVTATRAVRSAGGPHDFYSEGDYWWPDPENPGGPYVRRDGETNPDNFVAHRQAMRRLAQIVPDLASGYLLTRDVRYVEEALRHLRAWFVAPATRMNPSLLYAQAISGRVTGRGIGIIDTVHLVEVARAVEVLATEGAIPEAEAARIRHWFRDYLTWLTTHPYGIDERDHGNNHSTAWALQAAAFASLVGDAAVLADVRHRFRTVLLPTQMDVAGGFPDELGRTKPYAYSLFNLDMFAGVAQIASTPDDDLWAYETPDGRGLALGLRFIEPYVRDKSAWPLPLDVEYWDDWPVRHPALLFGGVALEQPGLVRLWAAQDAEPTAEEVIRNLPLRRPLLWVPGAIPMGTPPR
ncbi:MAG: alginate lyase family protein [Bacteroidota bacterium]